MNFDHLHLKYQTMWFLHWYFYYLSIEQHDQINYFIINHWLNIFFYLNCINNYSLIIPFDGLILFWFNIWFIYILSQIFRIIFIRIIIIIRTITIWNINMINYNFLMCHFVLKNYLLFKFIFDLNHYDYYFLFVQFNYYLKVHNRI